MAARPRLFLIDAYSNIFRAFFAIRDLSNAEGLPTNAVYGFVQMLRKLLRTERPDLIGAAFDVSDEETVRREMFADYKANRPKMPEDLEPQLPWIRRTLEAFRIPVVEHPGWEADDVLGTLSDLAVEQGYDVVLVSADKDLMQLVGPHVSLFHTGRDRLYDPAAVEEDFGVPPGQVADVLALAGDSVDNVPGVPGIGIKGAVKLVREFGSLDQLLERSEEVGRKSYREGLEQHREQATLSRELVTVRRDLPIGFDPELLRLEEPDRRQLVDIYGQLGFMSLLEELDSAEEETPDTVPVREVEAAEGWEDAVGGLGESLYLVTVHDGRTGIAVWSGQGEAVLADLRREGLTSAVRSTLESWLSDPEQELIGHDWKPRIREATEGVVAATVEDTLLQAYLLEPASRGSTLEETALERLGAAATSREQLGWSKEGEPPEPGAEGLHRFAGERLRLLSRLADHLDEALAAEPGLTRVYREIEAPLMPVLARMERRGILLDTEVLELLSEEFGAELAELERKIFDEAGHEFNLNSPKQLGEVLFDELGLPGLRRTRKTKSYSTDAATLEELAARGHGIAVTLLRYRELAKLKSTYIDALPGLVADDGRLHSEFLQAVAATGRLSSVNPNLQNIPVRTEDGRRIRRAFVAPPGSLLLVADYSQIELRVLAHVAEDEALIEAFRAGQDIHAATAASVFGVDPALVTGEQRRVAKMINFGIVYGMTAFGLSRRLGIPQGEAEHFIHTYLERYSGVGRYVDATLEAAREHGRVETLYGRIRRLPDLASKNPNLRDAARRMAINAPIQGTAADLLKLAMIRVDERLRGSGSAAALLLTVHDELLLEVPEAELAAVEKLVVEEMGGVADLAVPLVVETGSGASWFEAKEEG